MNHIKGFIFHIFTFALALPASAAKLEVNYPGGELNALAEEGGLGPIQWIETIYDGAFAIVGIVAFVSLVYAGIRWMTSRQEEGIKDAKDRIQGVVYGLLLLGASFLLLKLINPDLVGLRAPLVEPPTSTIEGARSNEPTGAEGDVCVIVGGIGTCLPPLVCKQAEGAPAGAGTCQPSDTLEQGAGTVGKSCVSGNCTSSNLICETASNTCKLLDGKTCDPQNDQCSSGATCTDVGGDYQCVRPPTLGAAPGSLTGQCRQVLSSGDPRCDGNLVCSQNRCVAPLGGVCAQQTECDATSGQCPTGRCAAGQCRWSSIPSEQPTCEF